MKKFYLLCLTVFINQYNAFLLNESINLKKKREVLAQNMPINTLMYTVCMFQLWLIQICCLDLTSPSHQSVSLARVLQTDELIGSLCLRVKPLANKHIDESKDWGLITSFLCKQSLTAWIFQRRPSTRLSVSAAGRSRSLSLRETAMLHDKLLELHLVFILLNVEKICYTLAQHWTEGVHLLSNVFFPWRAKMCYFREKGHLKWYKIFRNTSIYLYCYLCIIFQLCRSCWSNARSTFLLT